MNDVDKKIARHLCRIEHGMAHTEMELAQIIAQELQPEREAAKFWRKRIGEMRECSEKQYEAAKALKNACVFVQEKCRLYGPHDRAREQLDKALKQAKEAGI